MTRVLLVGESWFIHSIHQKGFDSFTTSEYQEGGSEFCQALTDWGHTVTRVPAHCVPDSMPDDISGYDEIDVVVVSDVGSNTFLLGPTTFAHSEKTPDKLQVLAEWVRSGGGLLMVGGYMSFTGIDAKARYGQSALAEILPVNMMATDDRIECPAGVPATKVETHVITQGLSDTWPALLGLNRVTAKHSAEVLATCGENPLLVVGTAGNGRTAAFTSDLAPHWAPPDFLNWSGYSTMWHQTVSWLGGA